VVGAHESGRVAGRSRYCRAPLRTSSAVAQPEVFLEEVERICVEHAIDAVMSNDDEGITQLLATDLPSPGGAVFVGPTAEQYDRVCDKGNLHETARAAGLDAPAVAYADGDGYTPDWPPLPSVVKPRTTQTRTAGTLIRRSAIVVNTPAERESAVAEICSATGGAIVEERIVGTAWRAHFVADGGHLAMVPVTTLRSSPEDAGMSSVQAVTGVTPPKLRLASQQLLDFLDYQGPGSFQFIERDGRFYLHDVNLRLPSSVALTMLAGIDMPRLAAEVALGRSVDLDSVPIRQNVRYVWLHGELRNLANRARERQPLRRVWEIASEILLAAVSPRRVLDQFVLTDPLPTVALVARGLRGLKRRPSGKSGQKATR
jgi:predicted ATP-grasp superfamily ATP-dependent carboligase